mmetsp:Transcript_98177/g.273230  ORF Transcript_98177/g.273230 Transcript_98177/m.273230 type:complete len:86 (+) Transcript_98177:337-594(+)
MVGVGGAAKAGLSLGANVFAGRHTSGESAKIILGISNFAFEYTFPLSPGAQMTQPAPAVSAPLAQDPPALPAPAVGATPSADLLG